MRASYLSCNWPESEWHDTSSVKVRKTKWWKLNPREHRKPLRVKDDELGAWCVDMEAVQKCNAIDSERNALDGIKKVGGDKGELMIWNVYKWLSQGEREEE